MYICCSSGDPGGREHSVHVHADQGGRGGGAEQDAVGAVRAGLTPARRAPRPAPRAPPPGQSRHLLHAPPAPQADGGRPRGPARPAPAARVLLLGPRPRGPARAQAGAAPQRLHRLRPQVLLRTRRQVLRN